MKRWMTVRYRIFGAFGALAVGLFVFIQAFAPVRLKGFHADQLGDRAHAVAVAIGAQHGAVDAGDAERTLQDALAIPDLVFVELRDETGRVFARAGTAATLEAPRDSAFRRVQDSLVIVQEHFSGPARNGFVRVAMSQDSFDGKLRDFRISITAVGLVILLCSAVVAFVASRLVVQPIERLTQGVRRLDSGELERIEVASGEGSEMVELAEAINSLRADLSASSEKIKRAARRANRRAAELERANVELDRFAYVASHDLRAPLRAIATLSEFIAEDLADMPQVSDDVRKHLQLLRQRVRRLDALLMSLLEYSRIGRGERQTEDVDVRALVLDVVDMLGLEQRFDVSVDEDLPTMWTSRTALELVFVHLLSNALKHHDREHGKLSVTYQGTPLYAVFTVEDDGPGIPHKLQGKAFEMFTTLRRRDEVEGSGMGLALIKKSLANLGGKLELESEGRGCRFKVYWPFDIEPELTEV